MPHNIVLPGEDTSFLFGNSCLSGELDSHSMVLWKTSPISHTPDLSDVTRTRRCNRPDKKSGHTLPVLDEGAPRWRPTARSMDPRARRCNGAFRLIRWSRALTMLPTSRYKQCARAHECVSQTISAQAPSCPHHRASQDTFGIGAAHCITACPQLKPGTRTRTMRAQRQPKACLPDIHTTHSATCSRQLPRTQHQ